MRADLFQATLSRLYLRAVLPAMEDLIDGSPAAREAVRGWNFSLRLQLAGGPGTTLVPRDGRLEAHASAQDHRPRLTLLFFRDAQVNRTFLQQPTLPPLPLGQIWRLGGLRSFTKLTRLLDAALQPSAEALSDPAFRRLHLRLLFKVLLGALPIIAELDPVAAHALATTPAGTAELQMRGLNFQGWARWDRQGLTAGTGPAPGGAPDTVIVFRDEAIAAAALESRLDPQAAVGLGEVQVRGLVPLADGLSVVMDRVENYLQPAGRPGPAAPNNSGAAASAVGGIGVSIPAA